jgi:hypothetical protein
MLTSDVRLKAPRILSSVYSCTPVSFHILMSISSEGGFFKARLTFPPEFPLLPPKMRFITPMWHPNSAPLFLFSLLCLAQVGIAADQFILMVVYASRFL